MFIYIHFRPESTLHQFTSELLPSVQTLRRYAELRQKICHFKDLFFTNKPTNLNRHDCNTLN